MLESRAARRDGFQGAEVFRHGLFALLAARHVLPEDVERRHASLRVEPRDAGERLLQRFPGDVAGRDPLDDGSRGQGKDPHDEVVEELHGLSSVGSSGSVARSIREARAKHHTSTDSAPARRKTRAHSRAVDPEVETSSTRRTAPGPGFARNAPRTFRLRRVQGSRLCRSVGRNFSRPCRSKGSPNPAATAAPRRAAGRCPPEADRRAGAATTRAAVCGAPSRSSITRAMRGGEEVRTAELEREKDAPGRAAVGGRGAQAHELGGIEEAAPA